MTMEKQRGKGPGQSLNEQQKSTDDAINERLKEEKDEQKLDPKDANNPANRKRSTDTASKKSGGGTQKNPGM